MKTIETGIPGLLVIEPTVHGDARRLDERTVAHTGQVACCVSPFR